MLNCAFDRETGFLSNLQRLVLDIADLNISELLRFLSKPIAKTKHL